MLENRLRNIHLRRIWWAVDSPSFLELPESVNYLQDEAHRSEVFLLLSEADQNPQEVEDYFQPYKHLAMGRYFEQLLIFLLKRDPRYEILDFNLQLIEEKVTKGELDLILFDYKHQVKRHWEIALKYYLQVSDTGHHDNFLGPSRRDYLGRKMKKLYENQLPLGQDSQIMQKHGILQSGLFLKGELFYPFQKPPVRPGKAQDQSPIHYYMDMERFKALPCKDDLLFALLKKPHWIGSFHEHDGLDLLDKASICQLLEEEILRIDRPQLVALCEKTPDGYSEQQRLFICPPNWPHQAQT